MFIITLLYFGEIRERLTMKLPAFGTPGNGTSITVNNEVIGAALGSVWSYTVTELNPPKNSNPFIASFDLEAGGTYSFGGLRRGAYRVVEAYESGYATIVITSNKYSGIEVVTGFEAVINLDPSEGKTVTFTNNINPAFAYGGVVLLPPPDFNYSIPPLQPVPVQASFDVDVNDDGRWDLVLGKPVVVFVNMTGAEGAPFDSGDTIQVSVEFEAQVYSVTVDGDTLATSYVIAFYSADDAIVPSSAGDQTITGMYQVNEDAPIALSTTYVTVKDTVELSLCYASLSKSSYGSPSSIDFDNMVQNSVDFINATYPVRNVTVTVSDQTIAGGRSGSRRDPYKGMLQDAQAAAQLAKLSLGASAIGVAVAPGDLSSGYFDYHGFPGAVGVSFGPAVKGVIALENYYTVPAHEIAHTFGLYYAEPEEYYISPTVTGSGVYFSSGEFRAGYSFMSYAASGTTGEDATWVNTDTTFEYIFSKTVVIPNDPEVLLVNGIIYENGTVEFPLDWIRMENGTPDTLTPGNYALRYVDETGTMILGEVSFDASFTIQTSVPDENGILQIVEINNTQAGFSFATPYPPAGTKYVQVIDSVTGNILETYDMANVKSFGCSAALDGTEGLNDWYVSDVNVAISALADPTTSDPEYGVKEIGYILDGTATPPVPGSSASLTIEGEGIHTLKYWAVDTNEIKGMDHFLTVKIDKNAPAVTINAPDDGAFLNSGSFSVLGVAPDSASGVQKVEVKVDGGEYADADGTVTWSFNVSGLGEGSHVIYANATDIAGNSAVTSRTYTVDNTGPVVTISSPAAGSYTSSNLPALVHSATDNLDPSPSLLNVIGWSTEEGTHTVTVTYVDAAGNTGSASVTYTVHDPYIFGGFSSPIPESQYNEGRTVPVKFQLTDSQGNFVTDAVARIYCGPVVNGEVTTWYSGYEKGGDTNLIDYNFAGNMYQFNLDTTGQLPGQWQIRVDLDDGSSHTVEINLK